MGPSFSASEGQGIHLSCWGSLSTFLLVSCANLNLSLQIKISSLPYEMHK